VGQKVAGALILISIVAVDWEVLSLAKVANSVGIRGEVEVS